MLGGFILLVANDADGGKRILALVILISCNDTFAYFAGVLFGKHKMAPTISPKKSWEGLIGGLIASLIGGGLGGCGLKQHGMHSNARASGRELRRIVAWRLVARRVDARQHVTFSDDLILISSCQPIASNMGNEMTLARGDV